MKVIKKNILINKYNKINIIKNIIKKNIIKYFIQNNNLILKKKSLYIFILNSLINKKKKNLCLFTSRKKGLDKSTNISRLRFRKFARLGLLNSYKIN